MTKEFILYEQALELKELGYDEPCFSYYNKETNWGLCWTSNSIQPYNHNEIEKYGNISAPLYQQAFRWFREKHNMVIGIDFKTHDKNGYFYSISWQRWANGEEISVLVWHHRNSWLGANEPLSSYEDAELACLKKLIEIVKNKSNE